MVMKREEAIKRKLLFVAYPITAILCLRLGRQKVENSYLQCRINESRTSTSKPLHHKMELVGGVSSKPFYTVLYSLIGLESTLFDGAAVVGMSMLVFQQKQASRSVLRHYTTACLYLMLILTCCDLICITY